MLYILAATTLLILAFLYFKFKKDRLLDYALASEFNRGLIITSNDGIIKYIDSKAFDLLGLSPTSKHTSLHTLFEDVHLDLINSSDAISIFSALIEAPTLSYSDTLNFPDGRRVKRTTQSSDVQKNKRLWLLQEAEQKSGDYDSETYNDERFNNALMEHQVAEYAKIAEELFHAKEDLQILANTDPLTGLSNRRSFMETAKQHIQTTDEGQLTAVLMLDIDKFKNINDTYGHTIGDLCIKSVTALIQKNTPDKANVGRMGGEEFACFFSVSNIDEAKSIAEDIRMSIQHAKILAGKSALEMTISGGLSMWTKEEPTIEAALARSDSALYVSKNNGRNQISSYSPPNKLHRVQV